MSNLTLRVSGEKKLKPLKRCDEGLEDFHKSLNKLRSDPKYNFLDKLSNTSSIEQQLDIIRNMLKESLLQMTSENTDKILVLESIVEIYLSVELKNPLKSALVRLFTTIPKEQNDIVLNIFISLLHKRFELNNKDLNECIAVVSAISGCFENFALGTSALVLCKDEAMTFLQSSLQILLQDLKMDGPPAKKLTAINGIHNTIRSSITLIQKTEPLIPHSFLLLSLNALEEQQLPLDTRSTCGILCIILSNGLTGNIGWLKLFSDYYSSDDSVNILCICMGILNTLPAALLNTHISFQGNDVHAFEIILTTVMAVSARNPSDPGLVLGVSRAVNLLTKSLITIPSMLTSNILHTLLSYTWTHLEHYMDAVRHLASSILSNIVALGKNDLGLNIFDTITEALDELSDYRRSKLVALCALVGYIPIGKIILKSPNLVHTLLSSIQESSGATHAVSTFDTLMSQHYKESENHSIWIATWVDPLIDMMIQKPNSAFEQVLSKVVRLHPDIIHYVLRMDKTKHHEHMGISLTCLRVSRKAGYLKSIDNDKWKGLVEFSVLEKCIYHIKDEVRLAMLALISDSLKSTETFTKSELNLIKAFFYYNINNESPAVRQKTLAIFKKVAVRFKDSLYGLEKIITHNSTRPTEIETKDLSYENQLLFDYNNFLQWLVDFCIDNLFPGASFSRRGVVLNMMAIIKELEFWTRKYHSKHNAQILLACLTDTYEENKLLAVSLLEQMPTEALNFDDAVHVKKYIAESIMLASSIKPPDSITAAYSLSLLVSFPSTGHMLWDIAKSNADLATWVSSDNVKELGIYCCLCLVIKELKRELFVAEENLLKAASSGPLYGQLFVIRYLLQKVNFNEVSVDCNWQFLIKDLVTTAFKCNHVVACIVNSSSPEGHLPMDFDYDVSNLGSENDVPRVTAQMVLLCSWRTVKDVSLLLGELAERAPITANESDSGLLSEEQILMIGEHLTTLLADTKHRGAFEQAYVGFCKLASMLWRYPCGNLHELPSKWLKETLVEITTNGKLCSTRRSAGIPFMIQGLVCTELEVGGGKCFQSSMETLLELGNNTEYSTETRTHAMNILRCLFRNSRLGEMVNPYVPKGIALAVQGFSANNWSERNSATLLLSALMTRIFGVPRSRSDILSWRNKMTGRIFFQRYPTLYGILLKHLESGSQLSFHSVYPVLLILGRLYPSSLEGTDSNLQLCKYIPFVNECAGSSVLKTRSLAASAMIALITPNIYIDHLHSVFLKIANTGNENLTHGLLLQIFNLLKFGTELNEECLPQLQKNIQTWTEVLQHIIFSSNYSFITKKACINILIQLASKHFDQVKFELWSSVESLLDSDLFGTFTYDHKSLGVYDYLSYAAILYLLLTLKRKSIEDFVDRVGKLIHHNSYDVYSVGLEIIHTILSENNYRNSNNNEITADIVSLVHYIEQPEERIDTVKRINNNNRIIDRLVYMLKNFHHHEDRILVFLAVMNIPLVFQRLLDAEGSVINFLCSVCKRDHELVGSIILLCINSYLLSQENESNITDHEMTALCNLLEDFTQPERDFECRIAAAQLLKNNYKNLILLASSLCALNFWTYVIRLLNDDEVEVRQLICCVIDVDVSPLRGLEIFMDMVLLSHEDVINKAALLVSSAIGDCGNEQNLCLEVDDKVFDKGDMNVYCEELVINKIACESLKKLLSISPSVLLMTLTESLSEWLSTRCSFKNKCSTLLELIQGYKNLVELEQKSSFGECPFLKVCSKNQSLKLMKLKNIMSAIG